MREIYLLTKQSEWQHRRLQPHWDLVSIALQNSSIFIRYMPHSAIPRGFFLVSFTIYRRSDNPKRELCVTQSGSETGIAADRYPPIKSTRSLYPLRVTHPIFSTSIPPSSLLIFSLFVAIVYIKKRTSPILFNMDLPQQPVYAIIPSQGPSIESDRLLLRPVCDSDAEALFAFRSRPEIAEMKSVD